VNDGRGTSEPFRLIGADWIDQAKLVAELNSASLSGLTFQAADFMPELPKSNVTSTRLAGKALHGARILVTDYKKVQPLEAGIVILQILREHASRNKGPKEIMDIGELLVNPGRGRCLRGSKQNEKTRFVQRILNGRP
jgi:uncharacterized protein YbbC (DUF1343 family)